MRARRGLVTRATSSRNGGRDRLGMGGRHQIGMRGEIISERRATSSGIRSLVHQRFFTPRLRFKNLDELNAWLLDKCIAYAKANPHPELTEQTIWEVFEAERPKLVPYAGRFDGFHAVPASVSKTCLVRFDNNKYSGEAWRATPALASLRTG
jgi:hypothetical protein